MVAIQTAQKPGFSRSLNATKLQPVSCAVGRGDTVKESSSPTGNSAGDGKRAGCVSSTGEVLMMGPSWKWVLRKEFLTKTLLCGNSLIFKNVLKFLLKKLKLLETREILRALDF